MKVLVTGGRGVIGRAVTSRLLDAGHEVVSADLVPVGAGDPGQAHQVVADVTEAGHVWPLVAGQDAVVHLAGIPEAGVMPDAVVFATNVLGTLHVLEAARAAGVHGVVWASSATLLGLDGVSQPRPAYLPVDEDHPARAAHIYALSKLVGESLALYAAGRSQRLSLWSLRLTLVLGPDNWEREGAPRLADPDRGARHLFAYVWVDDVADAVLRCLELSAAGHRGHRALLISGPDVLSPLPLETLRQRYFPAIPWRGGGTLVCTRRAEQVLGLAFWRSWTSHPPARVCAGGR